MYGCRVISSIAKRNKALTTAFNTHAKTSPSRVFSNHPSRYLFSPSVAKASFYGFTSSPKGSYLPYLRSMSTTASASVKGKEGLRFLVNGGPHTQKLVGIWLFGSAAWVVSMVVLGGVTRLTRSGLSMTDWKFTGSLPPLSDEDWLVEFDKYKQSPEYKQ